MGRSHRAKERYSVYLRALAVSAFRGRIDASGMDVPHRSRGCPMVATASTMLPLGTRAPGFSLRDVITGKTVSLADLDDQPVLLVMFISNHCPYVKHVAAELARIGQGYSSHGVAVVAIGSNDPESHPADAPARMIEFAADHGFRFPYLWDASQDVARAYRAACTPDFFVFDTDRTLVYRGQLDSARPSNDLPVDGRDLRAALDAALDGKPAPEPQRPSLGCNIKWKPGSEPDYFPAPARS
jgi:peroxiredoxin